MVEKPNNVSGTMLRFFSHHYEVCLKFKVTKLQESFAILRLYLRWRGQRPSVSQQLRIKSGPKKSGSTVSNPQHPPALQTCYRMTGKCQPSTYSRRCGSSCSRCASCSVKYFQIVGSSKAPKEGIG